MAQVMVQLTEETEVYVFNRRKQHSIKGLKKTKSDIVFNMVNKYSKLLKEHNLKVKTLENIKKELSDMESKNIIAEEVLDKLLEIINDKEEEKDGCNKS